MVAFAITGLLALLTLRIQSGRAALGTYVLFGLSLGLAYLDRTAVAALSPFYFLALGGILWKSRRPIVVPLLVALAAFAMVAAPFMAALSWNYGKLTIGESGKLNYGWEVNGAARSVHWQGEPGDIGTPLHPTRQILKEPVPVFEYGEPVSGPYPPWYDPSYWYDGIKMQFHALNQARVAASNASMFAIIFFLTPAAGIVAFLVVTGRGRVGWPRNWLRDHWAVVLPALAGVATYCLVFVDKRYVAGFVVILWITVLVNATRPAGAFVDRAVQWICLLFALGIFVPRFAGPTKYVADDLIHRREREWNVNWMLAQRFAALGVKPGDKVGYIDVGMNADWVRVDGVKVVAEVPVRYDRHWGITNFVTLNEDNTRSFFRCGAPARQEVYDAFRSAGAVIAVTSIIPAEADRTGWTRVIDPSDPHYPVTDGQIQDQATTYYHWLRMP
jgi:hypothetical protein